MSLGFLLIATSFIYVDLLIALIVYYVLLVQYMQYCGKMSDV